MRQVGVYVGGLCVSLVLLCAGPSLGQTISNVDGQVAHGNTVTIAGLNFGTRTIDTNLIFDTMETGSFSPRWSNTGSPGALSINTDNQRSSRSNYNSVTNFVGNQYVEHASFTGGSPSPSWYCQYWFKLGNDWTWQTAGNLANVKIFRLWSTGDTPENVSTATIGWEDRVYMSPGIAEQNGIFFFEEDFKEKWTIGSWHLFQWEFKDNSALGVADGVYRWWVDGRLAFETTQLLTRSAYSPYKRPYGVGWFNSWGDNGTDDNHFYMDDVYIDNSWGRVELGNAATYSNCTHREIQPPVSWSATQVRVTLNQGSFEAGDAAYLSW